MRICNRCECVVFVELDADYPYYCEECNENLYEFETEVIECEE